MTRAPSFTAAMLDDCSRVRPGLFLLAAACALSACTSHRSSDLTASATDTWTRSYPLDPAGEVRIVSPTGSVTIEAIAGNMVEVEAHRTVHAMTEESAREVLGRVSIREEAEPARVLVQTEELGGIVIGVRVEVSYRVRAPKSARVRVRTGRGNLAVTGFSGALEATAVNGSLSADGLSGPVQARVTNGSATVTLESVGENFIDVRSVNGNITLVVPESTRATVQATVVNGGFDVAGLEFERMGENTPRRIRGRINGGGPPFELSATNGKVRIASPNAPPPAATEPSAPDVPAPAPPPARP